VPGPRAWPPCLAPGLAPGAASGPYVYSGEPRDQSSLRRHQGEPSRPAFLEMSHTAHPLFGMQARWTAHAGEVPRHSDVHALRITGTVGHAAFEARTVLRPPRQASEASGLSLNETAFLDEITDAAYREALERFFDTSHGLDLRFEWGAAGTSIRLPSPYKAEPISLVWLVPHRY